MATSSLPPDLYDSELRTVRDEAIQYAYSLLKRAMEYRVARAVARENSVFTDKNATIEQIRYAQGFAEGAKCAIMSAVEVRKYAEAALKRTEKEGSDV